MSANTRTQRQPFIDVLNVVFAAVVLYLHHVSYTDYYLPYYKPAHVFLVYFSVGGFFFFSAYKLAQSKSAETLVHFWKNRFLRIIPLYWLAIIAFQIIIYHNQPNFPTIIKHMLGLQMILPELFDGVFQTLYFVGLLLPYYFFFAVTKKYLSKPGQIATVGAAVYASLFLVKMIIPEPGIFIDNAFLNYFPLFVAGMVAGSRRPSGPIRGTYAVALASLWFVVLPFFLTLISDPPSLSPLRLLLYSTLIAATLIPLFQALVELSPGIRRIPRIVTWLSSITYCIFLFHRPVWTLMSRWYQERSPMQWFYISVLGTAVIILTSALLQTGYNRLLRRFEGQEKDHQ